MKFQNIDCEVQIQPILTLQHELANGLQVARREFDKNPDHCHGEAVNPRSFTHSHSQSNTVTGTNQQSLLTPYLSYGVLPRFFTYSTLEHVPSTHRILPQTYQLQLKE